ncbi:MAG: tRNA epoxyqueuosine(34) reductase QueG [bacterium]
MAGLSGRLKEKARELGLVPAGITTAEPLYEARAALELSFPANEKLPFTTGDKLQRTTPTLVWPQAKSIIMVGLPFTVPTARPASGTMQGYFAAGSSGEDYHLVLRDKLANLAAFLQQEVTGAWAVPFVDTGPLMERALAQRAGMGIWGENGFLIRPEPGSAFFLGGLATDAKLSPDSPLTEACLKCGRCRDACPTKALNTPYRLDYRRCLSYWTQSKEIIPAELRPLLGNRLYGCDSCLRACPLIKKSPLDGVIVGLSELLTLNNREFKQRYGSRSFAWRGRTVLQRNAAIALGNSGQEEAVPVLTSLLEDERAPLRIAAAWSLGQIDTASCRLALAQRLQYEIDPDVRLEIESALSD